MIFANFDDQPLGAVDPNRFAAAMGGGVSTWAPNYDDMSIVGDGSGGRAVRTTLKAGTTLSLPSGQNGAVLPIELPGTYDKACVSYRVRFDSQFDWSLGGKLPGLLGVAPGVPPSAPAGGHPTSDGWSGRIMWVGPEAYSWAGSTNMAISYMYHPGQSSIYGDNIRWNTAFQRGVWHQVKQCYTMNTIGRSDGVLQAWIDGSLVVDLHNFVYRTNTDVHINYLEWDVFRGGGTLDWAGSRTGYIDIDNMLVTRG
ncbi:MAG TPA: hypothetical protein VFM01_06575 [Nakamurella sp.]|nr:hypothetical protein [Nakamurella sp.]